MQFLCRLQYFAFYIFAVYDDQTIFLWTMEFFFVGLASMHGKHFQIHNFILCQTSKASVNTLCHVVSHSGSKKSENWKLQNCSFVTQAFLVPNGGKSQWVLYIYVSLFGRTFLSGVIVFLVSINLFSVNFTKFVFILLHIFALYLPTIAVQFGHRWVTSWPF